MKHRKKNKLHKSLQVLIEGFNQKRRSSHALVPRLGRKGDAGFDLFVAQDTVIPPGVNLPPTDVPSGIRIKLPKDTFAIIYPRSSAYNNYPSLRICSAPIDENYTGPLNPRFQNLGAEPVTVCRGERLAQFVIQTCRTPEVYIVDKLPKTNRGAKRYGSSGR